MPEYTDQMGRNVSISEKPKRIVSLVPSQTELLFDLGLGEKIVGITKFCIHPGEQTKLKEKVGGTKTLNLEKIRNLAPDLIIGNLKENEKAQIEQLEKEHPVWMSDVNTLDEALWMIEQIAKITRTKGSEFANPSILKKSFLPVPNLHGKKFAYFIWDGPNMVVGENTFIHSMISSTGLQNAFANKSRYPSITSDDLAEANPDYILLSTEPYPFNPTWPPQQRKTPKFHTFSV